ncbi:DNA recombination protein RmuC [bacterium]|nr:DNA recombination protein RmuC [bacterium]
MDYITPILAGITVVLLVIILAKKDRYTKTHDELVKLKTLNEKQAEEIGDLREKLLEQLSNQQRMLLKELGDNREKLAKSLGMQSRELEKYFGKIETQVEGVKGKAEELVRQAAVIGELRDLLRAPKQRGMLGETVLELVLGNNFPQENYQLQYDLPTGGRVDAVVKLGNRLVPIDAKFPLEAFEQLQQSLDGDEKTRKAARHAFVKAVKDRVDEAAKYVRPEAGTMDFGFVFLPAEGIYAEAAQRRYLDNPSDDLLGYSSQRKIVLVSPSLLFAYLRTVYLGLKSLQIEERAEEIMRGLAELATAFHQVREPFEKVGKQLSWAKENYDLASRQFERADTKLGQLASEGVGPELLPDEEAPELLPGQEPPALPSDENGL